MLKKYDRLKNKIIRREKEKNGRREKKGKKKENSTNCKSPTKRQRCIATVKSVTEYTHIHIHP